MVYATTHYLPLIMTFLMSKKCYLIPKKKSPYRGSGDTPLPRSVALLHRFGPPLTNPGYTTVTRIAKGAQALGLKPMYGLDK